jgi:long-chain acyl-CoA synthetase
MTMKDRLNNLYDLFAAHAETNGDSAAFISADSTVSFGEFVQQVDRLAGGLHSQGLGKGDRLATVAKNSISHIAVLIACARLGAVAFPVNWRLASNELAMALGMVRPSALFIENDFYSALSDSELGQIKIKGVFGTETPSDTDWLLFEEFQSEHQPPEVSVSPNDPAVIIATAAVAGVPRGAVLTHGNMIAVSRMFASSYHLSKDDRGLGVLPLFHIAGYENVFVNAMRTYGCAGVFSTRRKLFSNIFL